MFPICRRQLDWHTNGAVNPSAFIGAFLTVASTELKLANATSISTEGHTIAFSYKPLGFRLRRFPAPVLALLDAGSLHIVPHGVGFRITYALSYLKSFAFLSLIALGQIVVLTFAVPNWPFEATLAFGLFLVCVWTLIYSVGLVRFRRFITRMLQVAAERFYRCEAVNVERGLQARYGGSDAT